MNTTWAVGARVTLCSPRTATAATVTVPGVLLVSVPVVIPAALVLPGWVMPVPRALVLKNTDHPDTALPLSSTRVTFTVAASLPLAGTLEGDTLRVEWLKPSVCVVVVGEQAAPNSARARPMGWRPAVRKSVRDMGCTPRLGAW